MNGQQQEPETWRAASGVGRWRWLRIAVPSVSGFESTRYLGKWLLLSTLIGIVAGLGAIAFSWAIQVATDLFLGQAVGYLPPTPLGEGATGLLPMARPWLLPLVVALGGLIAGLILFRWAPEAEGHGTDAAIAAIHHKQGRVRARIPPIKLIASAITIGSGGSGGREGPAAQISAGFGSLLGQWLKLSVQDRRIAVAAGMGAGIGAIFRAPLGGAAMAAEILYLHDLEVEALIPALIAAVVGYSLYGLYGGFAPIFGSQPDLALGSPVQLLYYSALGLVCGLGGLLYARSFYGITRVFHRFALPPWLKPALGGLLVGGVGLLIPAALHMGYGWVQLEMGPALRSWPLWLILLIPFVKILATSLSIGSSGSGGIFGPGMVIGGSLGAAFWRLAQGVLPQMPASPAPFVIVGMMALFGGIAHAPLAVMLMVGEMTGNLSLLAPAMVAVAVSTALVGNQTIYRSQLPNRASAPSHRVRFSFPLLSSLLVRDAMAPTGATLSADAPLSAALPLLDADPLKELGVVNRRGAYIGTLSQQQAQRVPPAQQARISVGALVAADTAPLSPEQPLDSALEQLSEQGRPWLAVIDHGRLIGRLTVRNAIRADKSSLQRSVRRANALPPSVGLFQVRLDARSPLIGRPLNEIRWPSGTLVAAIEREGETLFPRADARLAAGDSVSIMTDPASEGALRAFLESGTVEAEAASAPVPGTGDRH